MIWFWSLVALIFLAIEIYGSGFGFIFLTIGAVIIVGLLGSGYILATNFVGQLLIFLIFGLLFAAVFYYGICHASANAQQGFRDDDVGTIVNGDLSANQEGEIRWSGTIMKAKMHAKCRVEVLKEGEQVHIVEFVGNRALVTNLSSNGQ